MTRDLYADLAWLSDAPPNFRERCRALSSGASPGAELRALATHALGENQLRTLANAIDGIRASGRSLSPLAPFRLGIVGNGTLDYLAPALIGSAARHGIALECIVADYGQIAQEAFAPDSAVNRAAPDAVLLAIDARGLPLRAGTDVDSAEAGVTASLAFLDGIRAAFRKHCGAVSIVQTIAPPVETRFGSFDARFAGTPRALADAFNGALLASLDGGADVLLDVAGIAAGVGLVRWHSPKQWNVGKLPFDARYIPLYADHVARLLAAMRGKSRRALILDLDNTLWGGAVGDDGIDGIVLGQGDPTGEAFLDVQSYALALRERGIVLAVSSKNDDAIAREAMRDHPDMLLREEHVAAFAINWDDKASNVAALAESLALGLDAMVFLDDNPAERELVRSALPDVAVPELPGDPASFSRYLSAAGYFEATGFTPEDRGRAESYRSNAQRVELRERAGDVEAYLASLETTVTFAPFDSAGRARIVALVNKSNQFNLTTRRYNDAQIEGFERDGNAYTLQVRLADRFGDYGMIGVVICRRTAADTWEIDTWLMSCRVLGRRVEQMVLYELLARARQRGIAKLVGVYVPTPRNGLVREHYRNLGFTAAGENAGDASRWILETTAGIEAPPMEVVRQGFETSRNSTKPSSV